MSAKIYDPIDESLPHHTEEEATGSQPAWHAVVHLVVPCLDDDKGVTSADGAMEYISETLRGQFLDWAYVVAPTVDPDDGEETQLQTPIPIIVPRPYIEGAFLWDGEFGVNIDGDGDVRRPVVRPRPSQR